MTQAAASGRDRGETAPCRDSVDIWIGSVRDEQDLQWLSADERALLERIRHPGAARLFRDSRRVLRWLLAEHLSCHPGEIRFAYGHGGKPGLSHPPAAAPVHFNVSHSGSRFAVAIGRGGAVGLDIEQRQPIAELEALAERIMSPRERRHWRQLDASGRIGWFYRTWTRKEALLKLRGTGLAADPRRCDVLTDRCDGAFVVSIDVPGMAAAVATQEARPLNLRDADSLGLPG